MRVRVNLNHHNIEKLKRAVTISAVQTMEAIKTEVINEGVMPFDTGTMQNESMFVDDKEAEKGKISLVVDTPYARKLYYHPEYNFKTINNPNAQGRWFDPWIDGEKKDFAGRAFSELLKRNSGGVLH